VTGNQLQGAATSLQFMDEIFHAVFHFRSAEFIFVDWNSSACNCQGACADAKHIA
jgi:hypothetical protein